jgi:PKD repeat protein
MIAATPPSGTNTTIRSVAVSFGDGETNNLGAVSGTDIAVQHVYAAGGTYTVSATATDSGGGTAAASTVVAVRAAAPLSVSIAAGPMVPPGGGPKAIVTFAAAVFPATSVVTSYVWDFGDGSGTQQTTGNQLQHVFANPAVYTVTVTVTEALTGRTATNSVPVSTASGIPAVSIAASESPVAGRATTFKMSAVVAPGTSVSMQSVKVAFGDGASVDLGAVTGDAITASHVYASAGTYVASVTATDSGGGTATASTQVVVAAPGAPSVTASLVGAAVAGTPATFAVGATPAAGSPTTIQSVKVTFGDGTPSVDLGAITAPTTTQHVYAASGSYTVSVVATDSGGTTATASVQVVVGAPAPTVSVTAGANPVVGTPTTFTITAVAAAGSNTTIQNVRVAFGDGTPPVDLGAINAPTTTQHVYAAAGNYTVSATATVSNGATATASTQVAVAAPAPTVSVTAGANPVAGTATTFTITAAPAAGSNTTIQNVRVTFGDGSSADLGAVNSTTTQHVYAAAGNYTASATATVSNGATATASTQVVVVAPAPPGAPSLSIAPTGRPVANTPTTFTITTAPPPGTNATITNVRVNFGDNTPLVDLGALGASATTQHVYASPGTRTVSATATASNGGTATASTQVVIAAPPSPSISITAGANPVTGRAVTFSITTTPAPGSGTTIQNVRVNFGDNTPVADLGAVAGSATTQHVYAAAGTFTVTATAADTGGGTATATTSVIVVASATLSLSASAGPVASVAMQFTVGVAPGPGVTIQNVRLAYGDGTQDDLGVVSGTPRVQSHTYAASGVVTATLTVTIAGGTTPLTTSISVTVACGPLTNRTLTFTSLVIGMLQNWPGTLQTVSTGPSCLANIRAPTGAINAPSGNTWTLSSTVGYQGANCTLTSQVPTCAGGGGALQPNGRPFCPNADPALRSTAAVVVNCR